MRLVEVVVAAALHLQKDPIDVRHAELDIAGQVLPVHAELLLDLVERGEIVLQQREAVADDRQAALGERRADAERVEQLEMHARGRVERRADVRLERLEAAGRPGRGVALLRPQRQLRADREDLGVEPEQRVRALRDVPADVGDLLAALQDVDLVDDDHHLLAPAAHLLEKRALGLGERPVGRRDEQHEIGPRDEVRGDALVLADDGVRAGGIHDVDVAEQLHRGRDDVQRGLVHLALDDGAVSKDVDLGRRGGDPFLEDAAASQRVDERALAGVELADDHEEKELVELRDRLLECALVLGSGVEPHEGRAQA